MSLTDVEKVAVLLIALGPERAQRILDRLGPADLMPIVSAMKRMRSVDPEVRRVVLEEVSGLLTDLAAGRVPGGRAPEEPAPGAPERPKPGEQAPGLLGRVGPLLRGRVDPEGIDWDAVGFNFDDVWPRRRPEDGE